MGGGRADVLPTFCVAGLVAIVLGIEIRPRRRALGLLGIVLGIDMVVLGPIWWVSVGRLLWAPTASEVGDDT